MITFSLEKFQLTSTCWKISKILELQQNDLTGSVPAGVCTIQSAFEDKSLVVHYEEVSFGCCF
jgi:hypothetical protein